MNLLRNKHNESDSQSMPTFFNGMFADPALELLLGDKGALRGEAGAN